MIWKIIAAPVIGAIIGYFTNALAVKMLFRPKKAYFIGKFQLPFTPGVFPKEKARLAQAAHDVINDQLLTGDTLAERMLSDDMLELVQRVADTASDSLREKEDRSVKTLINEIVRHEDALDRAIAGIQDAAAEKIRSRLIEENVGHILSERFCQELNAAMQDSLLGGMLGNTLILRLQPTIENAVNQYIEERSAPVIHNLIEEESDRLLQTPVPQVMEKVEASGYDLTDLVTRAYIRFVRERSASIFQSLDIGTIAQQTIERMNNDEIEHLVLSTMNTELRAIVNLGALIGLILGLFNMLIYLI